MPGGEGRWTCSSHLDVDLQSLPRRHLQDIAKRRGIKANLKSTEIIAQLQHLELRYGKDAGAEDHSTAVGLDAPPPEACAAVSMDLNEAAKTRVGDGHDSPSLTWQALHEMLHARGTDGAMDYLRACLAHACSRKPGRSRALLRSPCLPTPARGFLMVVSDKSCV